MTAPSLMIKGKPIEEADRSDLLQAFDNLYREYSILEERHKRLQLKYVKRNISSKENAMKCDCCKHEYDKKQITVINGKNICVFCMSQNRSFQSKVIKK